MARRNDVRRKPPVATIACCAGGQSGAAYQQKFKAKLKAIGVDA